MDRKILIKLGRIFFCLGVVLSTFLEGRGQAISYTSNALSVDIFILNPCSGNNGAIKFTINSTTGGSNAQIAILGSPVNLFPSQSVAPGTTFIFNASHTLKPGSYSWIIGDGTETIGSLADPATYPAIVLTTILPPTVTKDLEVNNSSCSSPNGAAQASISNGSKALPGGGSFTYTWTTNNGLAGFPLTGTTDGTTPLNLATLLGLGGLPAGQYTLAVSDNYSFCSAASTVFTITDPSPVAENVNPTGSVNVCSNDNATISLQNSEAFPVVYHILKNGVDTGFSQNGTGSPLTLTLPNGNFANGDVLTVLASNQLCTPTLMNGSVTINIVPVPSITNVSSVNVTCNGGNDGSISVTASGGTGALTYILNPGAVSNASGIFSALTAQAYTITVKDANNCSPPVANVTITQPTPITPTITPSNVLCFGGSSGSINIVGSGGVGPYDFSIDGGATFPVLTSPNHLFNNLPIGTYNVQVRDASGCVTAVIPVTLTQPTAVGATITPTNILCFGGSTGSINVVGTGGVGPYDFSIDGGATFPFTAVANHSFGSLAAGAYSIQVRDFNGCLTAVLPVTLTQPASAVSATTSQINETCFGDNIGSITVTGGGGVAPYDFSIDGGTTFPAVAVASNIFGSLPAGSYSIVVRDANGCSTAVIPITITQPAAITPTITPTDPTCFGGTGSINVVGGGGVAPYDFSIDGGTTFPFTATASHNFTGLTAGAYNVQVRDASGCVTAITPVTLTQPTAVGATITPTNILCFGGSTGSINVAGTGGVGPYDFSIDGGATFPFTAAASHNFTSLPAGPYSIQVRDFNGCLTGVLPVTLTQPPTAVSGSTSQINEACFGDNIGSITVTGGGGVAPYDFSIDGGTTFPAVAVASNIFGSLPAGSYSIVVRDANGCSTAVIPITITQPAAITPTITPTDPTCFGGTGSINVVGGGGVAPYDFSIDGGTTFPFTATASHNFTGLTAGAYNVQVRDASGCVTAVIPVTLTQPTAVGATITPTNILCFGGSTGSINVVGTGGVGPYDFSIDGGATFPFTAVANHSFGSLAAGAYSIQVRDFNGCLTAVLPVTLTQPASAVSATTSQINETCFGDNIGSITVTGGGGVAPYDFSIDGGATFPAVAVASNIFGSLPAGSYSIVVRDANGCSTAVIPITITQPAAITPTITPTDPTCFGGTGSINVVGGGGVAPYDFSIDGGATFPALAVASNNFIGLAAGAYNVQVRDASGCVTAVTPVTLSQPTAVGATITPTNILCFGGSTGSINVVGTGGVGPYDFSIDGGATFPFTAVASNNFTSLAAGAYNIQVRDFNGCLTAVLPVTLTEPASALSGSTSQVDVLCFGGNTGSITITGAGGVAPYDFSIDGGATYPVLDAANNLFNNLTAGTYSLKVRDANGCETAVISVTINQPASGVTGTTTKIDETCFGDNIGSITITGAGGVAPYDFSIDGGTTYPALAAASNTFGSLVAGVYNLRVRDANGCQSAIIPVTITEPPQVTATISGSTNICNGTSANLSVAFGGAPVSSTWTFVYTDGTTNSAAIPSFFSSITFPVNPTTTTTYSLVSVVDNKGCTGTVSGSAVVTVSPTPGDQTTFGNDTWIGYVYNDAANPAPPVSNIDYNTTKYRGFIDETDISALGSSTYNSGSDVFDFNLSNNVPLAGANLCGTYLDDFSIHYKMQKIFAAGIYTFTVGSDDGVRLLVDGVNIINPAAFNTHSYQTFSGTVCLAAGSHDFEIQYFEHVGFSRLTFDYQVVPVPTAASPTICVNSAIPTLTATSSDASVTNFHWYSDAGLTTLVGSGLSFTPTAAQLDVTTVATTDFFVTSVYGCGESDPTTVAVNVVNTATITLPTPPVQICKTSGIKDLTTLVSALPSGGTFTFSGTGVTTSPNFDPTLVATSPTTISVDYTSGTCTASTQTFNIDIINTASITVPGSSIAVCQGAGLQDLTALVSATPAGGTFTFSSVSPGVSGTNYDPSAGSGTVTIKVDYAVGGCTDTKTFNFNVSPNAALSTSSKTVCAAAGNVNLTLLTTPTPSGGTLTFSGPSVTGNSFDPSTHGGSTVSINVTYNVTGCSSASGTILVDVRNASDPICTGGGTGTCATVIIDPVPTPATCALSTGSITFNVTPQVPLVNNTGVKIDISGPVNDTKFNSFVFNNLPAGVYAYTIEYGDPGCIKTGSVTIDKSGTVGTPVASSISSPVCFGDSTGSAIISITQPVDITGQALQWSLTPADPASWKDFTAAGIVQGIPAGLSPTFQQTLSIRKDASDLCYAGVTIIVPNGNPRIKSTFAITSATCGNSDGAITSITASGGGGGAYQFSIDGINFKSASSFPNIAGGVYTLRIKDQIGCIKDTTASVTFPGFVSFTVSSIPADCTNKGKSGKLLVTFTNPGTYAVGISLNSLVQPSKTRTYTTNNPSIDVPLMFDSLARGTYYLFAKGTGSTCSTIRGPFDINGVYALSFDATSVCNGNTLPSLRLSNITFDPTSPIEFTVIKKSTNSVEFDTTFVASMTNNILSLDFATHAFLQSPNEYQITSTQIGSSFCQITSDPVDYTASPPLIAYVGAITMSYPDYPTGSLQVINFSGGLAPYQIKLVQLTQEPKLKFADSTMRPVDKNFNFQYEENYKDIPAGQYKVTVQDSTGCVVSFAAHVPLDQSIYIPNIFTPNGDQVNDVFQIRNLPSSGTSIVITNRWGKEVFKATNYQSDWDGGGVSDGVYFYRLQIDGSNPLTGWIEVARGDKP